MNTTKKRAAEIASLRKLKSMQKITPINYAKKLFLMFYIRTYDNDKNAKTSDLWLAHAETMTLESFNYKKKMIVKFN